MSLFDSPICPLADDLYLVELDQDAPSSGVKEGGAATRLLAANDRYRQQLARKLVAAANSGHATENQSSQTLATSVTHPNAEQLETAPPPSAFLTVATITIQLSMLRQLSRNESTTDLAFATCDGLLAMLQPMPVKALKGLSTWEASVLDQISGVMEDLAVASSSLRDRVKSLLLSFAINRASLSSILEVLEAISQQETIHLAPQTTDLIKRLRSLRTRAELRCDWSNPIKSFPIRAGIDAAVGSGVQMSIAPSSDSSFLYISNGNLLRKVGSGESRVLGSFPTLQGHVYASSPYGGFVFLLEGKLYTAVRRKGSSLIEIFERDLDSLELKPSPSPISLSFPDISLVESESFTILSTLGDDKGGKTICWSGPDGWLTGRGTKCYFEVVVNDDSGTLSVGWCAPEFASADNLRLGGAGDAYCWGVDVLTSEKFADGNRTSYGTEFQVGDVLGCALEVDENAQVLISFSRNGSWDFPMGLAFKVPLSSTSDKFRPLVSYSCDEHDAPSLRMGGVYSASTASIGNGMGFRFSPPSSDFMPVCSVVTPVSSSASANDINYPSFKQMGLLPPLASDGTTFFHAWMDLEERPGVSAVSRSHGRGLLRIDSYTMAATTRTLVLTKQRRLRRSAASSASLKVFRQPLSHWTMTTNGSDIIIGAIGPGDVPSFTRGVLTVETAEADEFVESLWQTGRGDFDVPQALCFDQRTNHVWAWSELQNMIWIFENFGIGHCWGQSPPIPDDSSSRSAMEVCEFVGCALARLTAPFLLDVPLNHDRTRCAICDHPEVSTGYSDIYLDPFDPRTVQSLSKLLEFSLSNGSATVVESFLALLLVNIHVAFCSRSPDRALMVPVDVSLSLKRSLFKACQRPTGSVSRLARRVLCEAIPLFWPTCEDKIAFVRLSFEQTTDDVVTECILKALNEQILKLGSFPVQRALLDDSFLSGLLEFTVLEKSVLAEAASNMVMSFLLSGFHHLQELAISEAVSVSPVPGSSVPKLTVVQSTSTSAFSGARIEEEESKEEETSSLQANGTAGAGAKAPLQAFDDVIGMVFKLFEQCIRSKFGTSLSRKALPLALVCLDNLLCDANAKAKAARAVLRADSQSSTPKLAMLALTAVQAMAGIEDIPVNFTFTRLEHIQEVFTPKSFALRNFSSSSSTASPVSSTQEEHRLSVHIPFVSGMSVAFSPRSELATGREYIRFFKHGRAESIGSERGYTGKSLPGTDIAPLIISSDRFDCLLTSTQLASPDGAPGHDPSERFTFRVEANRVVKRDVVARHWLIHVFEGIKKLMATVLTATVGSAAFPLAGSENNLMRWVQNAVFSGGLRSTEDFPPRPSLKRGSRSSIYSSGEFKSYLAEDAEALLNDLLTMKTGTPATLGGALVTGMRQGLNRVPFDQGRLTQSAVCAIAAALIRTNGLESDAVSFAKAVAAGIENSHSVRAPARLRALWSASQLIRAWCDSLVVNRRAKRHLEACGIDAQYVTVESKDDEGMEDDEEDFEYSALCHLVVSRCEFIVRTIFPPPILRQTRKREDALARWHFLRERFLPRVSRYVERDPLGAVSRGILAWACLRRQPSSPGHRMTMVSSSNSPPINYTPSQTDMGRRSLRKLVSSDDVLQPAMHVKLSRAVETLTRRASLSSWGSTLRRKQSWLGVETIDEFSPSSLSSPTSSAGGPASARSMYRRGSVTSTTGAGVRIRSRAEGGLRRASVDGILEDIDVVDVAQVEHEQSLSESVLNFVQSPSIIRKRDMVAALKSRNERAQARFTGLSIVVAIAQGSNYHSKFGRELFESLLSSVMDAIRSCGSLDSGSTIAPDPNVMEAHFLTDLAGCSVVWRERVTAIFLAFLRVVSHQSIRVARSYRFRPQVKACEHLRVLLSGVILDYVESDYSLLYRGHVVDAIRSCMTLPRECNIHSSAWRVFELLFRRCIVDHAERNSITGHIVQQQLMDVLIQGISNSGELSWGRTYDGVGEEEEDEDEDVAEQEMETEEEDSKHSEKGLSSPAATVSAPSSPARHVSSNEIRFLQNKFIRLAHSTARFLSKPIRVGSDFALSLRIDRSKGVVILPGNIISVGGDYTRKWVWMEIMLTSANGIQVRLEFPGKHCMLFETGLKLPVTSTKLAVSVSREKVLRIFAWDESSNIRTADSYVVEVDQLQPLARSQSMDIKTPSPVQSLARSRRLSARASDIEQQSPALLAGHIFVGCNTKMGTFSCQGLVVSNVVFQGEKPLDVGEFFEEPELIPQESFHESVGISSAVHTAAAGAFSTRPFALEQTAVLRSLDLAHSATRKGSSIALARLSTPSAQSILLKIVLDSSAPIQVRVASARVLRSVLREVNPSMSTMKQLGLCVARSMPPASTKRNEFLPDPKASSAIASEVVDLMHSLCDSTGGGSNWSNLLSNWIIQKMGFLDYLDPSEKLSSDTDAVRETCAALAFCGGKLDFVHVGGKALVLQASSSAAASASAAPLAQRFVRIVSQDYEGETEIRDLTRDCTFFSQPLSTTTMAAEDLSLSLPGTLFVNSPSPIHSVKLLIGDYQGDSPRDLIVRAGPRRDRMRKAQEMEVDPRPGWVTIYSHSQDKSVAAASSQSAGPMFPEQMTSEDDDHCLSLHIKSVWGYTSSCRILRIKVLGFVKKQTSSAPLEADGEARFVCVPTLEDEEEGEEEEEEERQEAVAVDGLPGASSTPPPPAVGRAATATPPMGTSAVPAIPSVNDDRESTEETSNGALKTPRSRFSVYHASMLLPQTSNPPTSIMEGISAATNHEVFEAFHRLLQATQNRIETNRGAEKRLAMDLQVRILKSICLMIGGLSKTHPVSREMASFLLRLAKLHNAPSHPVPVAARFIRNGVPEQWKLRFVSGTNSMNDDSVRFEPLVDTMGTSWPHRFAVADVDLTQAGKHSWTFTLMQDSSRGDETVLFGVCTDRTFPSGAALSSPPSSPATNSGSTDAEEEELDLLSRNSKFRFLRAFDGSAIGAHPPSPMLCVRVGDSLRCELDLDRGTLSMAVNNRPLVCVFSDIAGPVWPCVGTYSERGTVIVSMTNMKCTAPPPRRKCAIECRNLSDTQVESLTQQAFQALCAEGDDASQDQEERSLTFVGVSTEDEDDDQGSAENGDDTKTDRTGEDGESTEEEEYHAFDSDSTFKMDSINKPDSSSSALLLNKPPVLYRIEDSVGLHQVAPVSALNSANIRTRNMIIGLGNSLPGGFAGEASIANVAPLPSFAALGSSGNKQLSNAARYEALLWELLARLSRRAFDSVVAHWPTTVQPDEYMTERGLGEAVAALHRVSVSKEASLELLKVVNVNAFMNLATKRIVNLGAEISTVKRNLKRPRRKADAS